MPLCVGIWPPSNTWLLGPTRVHNPDGIWIGLIRFCRADDCDRQTDRPSYSICNNRPHCSTIYHTPQPFYGRSSGTTWGEPVPEENFWTLWCNGKLTEADTQTIRLGATPSGLSSAHLHHPPIFCRPDALPAAQATVSKH